MYLRGGLISQSDSDVGDSAHRHGFWETAKQLRMRLGLEPLLDPVDMLQYREALNALGFPEAPVRHPADWRGPKDFSRDQMIPNLTALSLLYEGYEATYLDIIENKIRRNYSRLPNGDIATPQIYNLFAHRTPSVLGLFELAINSLLCSLKVRWNRDDVDQTLNTFCMFAFLYVRFPNRPLLRLCRQIFKRVHPSVQAALDHYFRSDSGGNPEIADAWKPITQKLLT